MSGYRCNPLKAKTHFALPGTDTRGLGGLRPPLPLPLELSERQLHNRRHFEVMASEARAQ